MTTLPSSSLPPTMTSDQIQQVAIIGGGPAGLMAAEVVASAGYQVALFDAMPSVGRKFLLAGVGGMNITHSEEFANFIKRYAEATPWLSPLLQQFDAEALRDWVHGLGVKTFVGSSGRVFPTDMKAAPLLRAWLHRLRELGVAFYPRHRWLGWSPDGDLILHHQINSTETKTPSFEFTVKASACLLALGGASWSKLGSNGHWVPLLRERNVAVCDLRPSNCGFLSRWSQTMREQHAGTPLHTVEFSTQLPDGSITRVIGEAIVSDYGIEGSAIYALSAALRTQLEKNGVAHLSLDLLPDLTLDRIISLLQKPRGKNSLSNFLRKVLNVPPVKIALLRELSDKSDMSDSNQIAHAIKQLTLPLYGTRPIDEAISCAGGVQQKALNTQLMLRDMPGVFCAGEMLDWEAPTGGYLLTACFATGRAAGQGIVDYLKDKK